MLLAGPPGAGKTAVAHHLATTADRPTVHVPTDQLYLWIKAGYVVPYLPEAASQNAVIERVMVALAREYLAGGYDVILEGILGPWALPAFAALDYTYIVLRPSLTVALGRATARGPGALTIIEPIKGLYHAFEHLGDREACVIDSSTLTIAETAEAVRHRDGRPTHRPPRG